MAQFKFVYSRVEVAVFDLETEADAFRGSRQKISETSGYLPCNHHTSLNTYNCQDLLEYSRETYYRGLILGPIHKPS